MAAAADADADDDPLDPAVEAGWSRRSASISRLEDSKAYRPRMCTCTRRRTLRRLKP